MQIRIRLPKQFGTELKRYTPRARGRLLAMLWIERSMLLDLDALIGMRRELANLGTLINQSLKISGGQQTDTKALAQCVQLLRRIHADR